MSALNMPTGEFVIADWGFELIINKTNEKKEQCLFEIPTK